MKTRCDWVTKDQIYIDYHDKEWGRAVHDDNKLFEFLILETFQAGLSWITILKKRENFREAFDNFDFEKVAKYGESKFDELIVNAGIIRNKLKIRSAISNAQAYIKVREEFGTFDKYIWSFVNYEPIVNHWRSIDDVPANTELSDKLSKDLKKRGFKFVGTTVVYAHMQATGMVNDHTIDCDFRF
ncbi:MAG: DNA-3-methyladenine glycosylase I [Flavobacteriales bacterium]|nr:DNA-3-methyladenine glycosylase I [Flavobacteriales bacterium]